MKIYKLTSPNTDLVYVGKTERELNVRYNEHIRDYRNRVGMCSSYKIIECEEVQLN